MSSLSLRLAFQVGRTTGRPGALPFSLAFRVGEGSGLPATLPFSVAFSVLGLGRPAILPMPLSFALDPVDPSIFAFGQEAWVPSAQRVWSNGAWLPGVT